MNMISQNPIPAYMLIRQYVLGVASRPENDGKKIMSIRELCKLYKVSHPTVMKALEELIDEGILVAKPGLGTFVNARCKAPFAEEYTRFKRIGVVVSTGKLVHYDYLYQRILSGVFNVMSEKGGIAQLVTPLVLDASFENVVTSMSLDGVVWVNPDLDCQPCMKAIDDAGIPLVSVSARSPKAVSRNFVAVDFFQAGYIAAERLLSSGHSRILHVFENVVKKTNVLDGARAAYAKAGLELGEEFFLVGGCELIEKIEMMTTLGFDFSAIFADGNFALPLSRLIEKRETETGKSVELVFMDDAYSTTLEREWPLVKCPLREMGEVAAGALLRIIDGEPSNPVEMLLDWTIVERG